MQSGYQGNNERSFQTLSQRTPSQSVIPVPALRQGHQIDAHVQETSHRPPLRIQVPFLRQSLSGENNLTHRHYLLIVSSYIIKLGYWILVAGSVEIISPSCIAFGHATARLSHLRQAVQTGVSFEIS